MTTTSSILIIAYLFLNLFVGIWAGRGVKDMKDFAIAGKSYNAWVIFFTIAATFVGGGFTMGIAGKTYLYGLVMISGFFGICFKEFLVAFFIAPRIAKFPDAISIGDVLDTSYGRWGRIFGGVSGFFVCIGIVGAQISGLSSIISQFFGVPYTISVVIGVGIVTIYSAYCGIKSVVITDIMQFIVLFIGISSILIFGIYKNGGVTQMISHVPSEKLSFLGTNGLYIIFISFIFWAIGETLTPAYFTRLLIGRNNRQVIKATYATGIFTALFVFVPAFIGLLGYSYSIEVPLDKPNVVIPLLMQKALPDYW
jgi:SSS family solute:Na+ symporter